MRSRSGMKSHSIVNAKPFLRRTASEPKPQRKLDLPIGPLRRRNRPRAADPYRRVRQSKLRMIEAVEELGPKLQLARLTELEFLGDREVEVVKRRRVQRIPSQRAPGERRRRGEGSRIEP